MKSLMRGTQSIARQVMVEKAWAYYSSAADDEITNRENHMAYHRIWFRPKILVDVEKVDFSTTILGQKSAMPFYVVSYFVHNLALTCLSNISPIRQQRLSESSVTQMVNST